MESAVNGLAGFVSVKENLFRDQSPRRAFWASILIGVSLVVVMAAERDLQHRSPTEVKGSKLVWRLVCLNAIGALSYFRLGRRPTQA